MMHKYKHAWALFWVINTEALERAPKVHCPWALFAVVQTGRHNQSLEVSRPMHGSYPTVYLTRGVVSMFGISAVSDKAPPTHTHCASNYLSEPWLIYVLDLVIVMKCDNIKDLCTIVCFMQMLSVAHDAQM